MKKYTLEMVVGLFMMLGFAALVYLALNLGEVSFLDRGSSYFLEAEFDNISGIKKGATVQIAGVVVGEVSRVRLNEDRNAQLTFKLDKGVDIPLDSIASVKSQGIIGDKYIQISLGGDLEKFEEHGLIVDTESAVDIESLISKFAFGSAR